MTAFVRARTRGLTTGFWMAVLVVFVLQAAFIFIAARRPPGRTPSPQPPSLAFRLDRSVPSEWAALQDPTLFVLPTLNGFSGVAWMRAPVIDFQPRKPNEPEGALVLDLQALGNTITRYIGENALSRFQPVTLPEPAITFPRLPPLESSTLPSSLRIEGELASRALLNPEPLPPVIEAYTNTVVDVLVDPQGFVFSSIVAARSGSTNDDLALKVAHGLRFEPLPQPGPTRTNRAERPMTPGTLIFEWRPAQKNVDPSP